MYSLPYTNPMHRCAATVSPLRSSAPGSKVSHAKRCDFRGSFDCLQWRRAISYHIVPMVLTILNDKTIFRLIRNTTKTETKTKTVSRA